MSKNIDKEKDEFDKENSDDIYSKEDVEEQMENDEIDSGEAGFMEGYESPNMIVCKKCNKKLKDDKGVDLEKCHETEDEDGNPIWICDCCEEEE